MTDFNLEEIGLNFDIFIKSKNRENPEDAKVRRFKDISLFIITMMAIVAAIFVCAFIIIFKSQSSYAGIALNGLVGVTMALSGYYVRGKSSF